MKNYTDKKIVKELGVSAYEIARYKLYSPDSYDKMLEQLQLSRGKYFTIGKYKQFIKHKRN